MHSLSLLLLAALALGACHRVGALDDAGAPDADTDTDIDADVDGDADADTDDECPGPAEEVCAGAGDLQVVFDSGETAFDDQGYDVRLLDFVSYWVGEVYDIRVVVLAEIEISSTHSAAAVFVFDLDENALGGSPSVGVAGGIDFDNAYRAIGIARPGSEMVTSWEALVLLCQDDELNCIVGGVPAGIGSGSAQIQQIGTIYLPEYETPAGISVIDDEILIYGERLWVSTHAVEWTEVPDVDDGTFLRAVGAWSWNDWFDWGIAVGDVGRMFVGGGSWEELPSTTDQDLLCAAAILFAETEHGYLAGGREGTLLFGKLELSGHTLCQVSDDDITSLDWAYSVQPPDVAGGATAATVATETGSIADLFLWSPYHTDCVVAELSDPVVALKNHDMSDGCLLTLALTEDALFANIRYCVEY